MAAKLTEQPRRSKPRKPLPPAPTPRWLTRLALGSVGLAVVVLFGLWPPDSGDLYMWLMVGRWTWEHGWPPVVDVFTYTTPGAPFLAHSWLAGLLFYGIDQLAGWYGFSLLRLGLVSTALAFTIRTGRLLGASWASLMLLAPVVLWVVWGRVEVRPYLITTALLSAEIWLLISVHTGKRSWRWLWLFPPMLTVGINAHGGWPQLIILLLAVMSGVVVMSIRAHRFSGGASSHLPMRRLGLILAVGVAALWVNPYGTALVTFPPTMQQGWIRTTVWEWQSPWQNPNWAYLGGGRMAPFAPIFFAYLALLVGVLLVQLRRWRTADLVLVAVMSLWLALGLWQQRSSQDAVLLSSAFVAACLPRWQASRWPWVLGSLAVLVSCIIVVASQMSAGSQEIAWLPRRHPPHDCLDASIVRLGLSGRVYTSMTHSLLYRHHPRFTVPFVWEFVSGPERFFEGLRAVTTGMRGFQGHLDRYDVDLIIWQLTDVPAFPVVRALQALGWALVHVDDRSVIQMRASAVQHRPVYRWIVPEEPAWGYLLPGVVAAQVLEEANRAVRECPSQTTFVHHYRAPALHALGRDQEAAEATRQIPPMVEVSR